MNKKRGTSHLEIVLSFVIFISFLFFMLIFFNPFKISASESSTVTVLERNIPLNISTPVSSISIKLNLAYSGSCFEIQKMNELAFSSPIIARNSSDKRIEASSDGVINLQNYGGQFFYIYSSEEFNENAHFTSCTKLQLGQNYTAGLLLNRSLISNRSLFLFKNQYESSYSELKSSLKVPPSENFLVTFRDTQNNILMNTSRIRSANIKVSASDTPVTVIDENGGMNYALMHIEVW